MANVTLSPKSAKAAKKYGIENCVKAYREHVKYCEGASTIAAGHKTFPNTNACDAGINAGREYVVFTQGSGSPDACDAALDRIALKVAADKTTIRTDDTRYDALNDAYCKALLQTEANSTERIFIFDLFAQVWEAGYKAAQTSK
jgi:hypothetical protein